MQSSRGRLVLSAPGQHLVMPQGLEAPVQAILGSQSFEPRELPGQLSANTRRALVRRLLEVGVIEPCGTGILELSKSRPELLHS